MEGLDVRKEFVIPSGTIPSGSEAVAIRSELADILASHHFRNSKRCQSFLRFVVEAAIEGHHDLLKERSIGVGVFGREASYDTSQDAVVRNASVEVRKRLAQYYQEGDHRGVCRIDLTAGSYVPVFLAEPPPSEAPNPAIPPPAQPPAALPKPRPSLVWVLAIAAPLLAAVCTAAWLNRRTAASELEAFWAPLFRRNEVIQISVGQPRRLYRFIGPRREELDRAIVGRTGPGATDPKAGQGLSIAPTELTWIASDYLYMRDAFSMAKIAALIQSKGYSYQLLSVSNSTYSQLRRSPVVAIGAFDNPWALHVTAQLRFVFDHKTIDGTIYNCVTDRRNPKGADWMVAQPIGAHTTRDYAIVTRALDPATERTAVSVAGIENYGTLAAGEFVTDPEYLGATLRAAPKDWRGKNVQIVLATDIIDGTPGPPKVLATYFW